MSMTFCIGFLYRGCMWCLILYLSRFFLVRSVPSLRKQSRGSIQLRSMPIYSIEASSSMLGFLAFQRRILGVDQLVQKSLVWRIGQLEIFLTLVPVGCQNFQILRLSVLPSTYTSSCFPLKLCIHLKLGCPQSMNYYMSSNAKPQLPSNFKLRGLSFILCFVVGDQESIVY